MATATEELPARKFYCGQIVYAGEEKRRARIIGIEDGRALHRAASKVCGWAYTVVFVDDEWEPVEIFCETQIEPCN